MSSILYDPDVPVQYVPIQAVTIPVTAIGNTPITGDVLLCGWSFAETTGVASAALVLWDGSDTTGQQVAFINLSQGQSVQEEMPFPGIYCTRGLFVQVTAGSVQGVVWVRDI